MKAWNEIKAALIVSLLWAVLATFAGAQVTSGALPAGGGESVGLANLQPSVAIPLIDKPGVGMAFQMPPITVQSVDWAINWSVVNGSRQGTWQVGGPGIYDNFEGTLNYSQVLYDCWSSTDQVYYYYYVYSNLEYTDVNGATHDVGGWGYGDELFVYPPDCDDQQFNPDYFTGYTYDSSGYEFTLWEDQNTESMGYTGPTTTDGRTFELSPRQIVDRNGNTIKQSTSGSTTTYTGTLGTTAMTVTNSGNTPTYSYPNPGGSQSSVTEYDQAYTLQTNFGCSSVSEFSQSNYELPIEVMLPDGREYTFTWETTPDYGAGYTTGRLASVELPTGATISYTYTGENDSIDCANGGTSELARQTPDGTINYTRTTNNADGGAIGAQVNVLSADNRLTVSTFDQSVPTGQDVYAGSTTSTTDLLSESFCYGNLPCGDAFPDWAQRTTVFTLPDGLRRQEYTYRSYENGGVVEQDIGDWGTSGNGGPWLRKTITGYGDSTYPGLPTEHTVEDGSGNIVADTHDTMDAHGNATSIAYYTSGNPGAGGTTLTRSFTYNSNGTVATATDANGAKTTYVYGDCNGAFPTEVDEPVDSLKRFMTWNCDGGITDSHTDENGQKITVTGWDANYWRPTTVTYPDGGETDISYSSADGGFSVEAKRKMSSSGQWTDGFADFDGLGRETSTAVANGASAYDRVDTCYNAAGRAGFVSYPYQSSSGGGAPNCSGTGDTFLYDALGRTTSATHSDSSVVTTSYTGRAVETSDEGNGTAHVIRVAQTDGLGELTSVCEAASQTDAASNAPAACGQDIAATGFLTSYQYDALGDLTQVGQGAETRTFAYDEVGRMASAANPESGTTQYVWDYDSNCGGGSAGDLASVTDARNVRTCYQYDGDHRLIGKSYSDGTPATQFAYDQSSFAGNTLANTLGRLSTESSGSTAAVFSYDSMGRTTDNWQCFTVDCSSGVYHLSYGYDLAGDATSSTNGEDVTLYSTFNPEQQLTGLTSSLSDDSHPGTLASAVTYWPNGALDTAMIGNGVSETRSQDALGRTTSIADGSAYSVSIGYAPDSDVTSATDSIDGTWTYGYGAQNRLASSSCTASCPDGSNDLAFSYSYDRYGNRWEQTVTAGSGPSPQLTFTAGDNRIDDYSYDAAGDLLNDGAHAYAYDAEHRVISVDNGSTTYSYNAAGQRVTKDVGGTIDDDLYDMGGNLVTEITSGVWSRGEAYAGGRRWATYANDTTYFSYDNWLGTVRENTEYGGGWTQTCADLPFGDGLSCTNGAGPSPIDFTGKPRDTESNLDDFGARYNSSTLGRFMTPDSTGDTEPMPFAVLDNPQTFNLYSYTGNNPATFRDNDGHCWPLCTMLVGAAAGAVFGGGVEAGIEFLGRKPFDWSKIENAAVAGGIAGAIIGVDPAGAPAAVDLADLGLDATEAAAPEEAAGGAASKVLKGALAATGNALGGAFNRGADGGNAMSPQGLLLDGIFGAGIPEAEELTSRVFARVLSRGVATQLADFGLALANATLQPQEPAEPTYVPQQAQSSVVAGDLSDDIFWDEYLQWWYAEVEASDGAVTYGPPGWSVSVWQTGTMCPGGQCPKLGGN